MIWQRFFKNPNKYCPEISFEKSGILDPRILQKLCVMILVQSVSTCLVSFIIINLQSIICEEGCHKKVFEKNNKYGLFNLDTTFLLVFIRIWLNDILITHLSSLLFKDIMVLPISLMQVKPTIQGHWQPKRKCWKVCGIKILVITHLIETFRLCWPLLLAAAGLC